MISTVAVEYVWTITAMVGLAVQFVLTRVAWKDLAWVYGNETNGAKLAVAKGSVEMGCGLMLVHGCFVVLGVRALLMPNRPLPWSTAVLIPIGLFMAASLILVLVGLNEARRRRQVSSYS